MTTAASHADCSDAGAQIICQGTDRDGFSDDRDGLTLTVRPGAAVSDDKDALKLEGDGNRVTNRGTINGGDEAIVGGTALTVVNRGAIFAGDKGIDTEGSDGLRVINAGLIDAADKALRAGPDDDGIGGRDLHLTNTATGVILSGDEGVEAGDDARVENAGRITAAEDAVQIGEHGVILNSGIIASVGDDGDGIDIDSGRIENTGQITALATTGAGIDVDAAGFDLEIVNTGLIRGNTGILVEDGTTDTANTQSQIIDNAGLIEGTGGMAFALAGGRDVLTLYQGGALIGAGDFGSGNDVFGFGLDYFDTAVGAVAGGAVIDGGTGFDRVSLASVLSSDISGLTETSQGVLLSLYDDSASVLLSGFEQIGFADARFRIAADGVLAPVPLPAGLVLLVGALGALGLARRRGS